jgi:hypothetical protein
MVIGPWFLVSAYQQHVISEIFVSQTFTLTGINSSVVLIYRALTDYDVDATRLWL